MFNFKPQHCSYFDKFRYQKRNNNTKLVLTESAKTMAQAFFNFA